MQGIGPRFALEAAFLIALAIGAAVADLSAGAIVVVMTLAWLLVCLFELAVWAEGPRFPGLRLRRREVVVEEEEQAADTEIREPQAERRRRRRFWRRRREMSGEGV